MLRNSLQNNWLTETNPYDRQIKNEQWLGKEHKNRQKIYEYNTQKKRCLSDNSSIDDASQQTIYRYT